jgi:hypothetical protein
MSILLHVRGVAKNVWLTDSGFFFLHLNGFYHVLWLEGLLGRLTGFSHSPHCFLWIFILCPVCLTPGSSSEIFVAFCGSFLKSHFHVSCDSAHSNIWRLAFRVPEPWNQTGWAQWLCKNQRWPIRIPCTHSLKLA